MNKKLIFAVLAIVCCFCMLVSGTVSQSASKPPFMVVRGLNSGIYYRLFNEATSTWGEWVELPGKTSDSPGAAYVGDELCVVVRGLDGWSLWQGFVNVDTGAFSGWTRVSGATLSAPELGSASSACELEPSGYISVPAAAFRPHYSTDVVFTGFATLRNMDTKTVYFSAGVQLPQGAVITNITVYWTDWDPGTDLRCELLGIRGGTGYVMASVYSTGSAGEGSTVDTSVVSSLATVDNGMYAYGLEVTIPAVADPDDLYFRSPVLIGFEYPT
ncbi:MAG: hypothetical protein R3319_05450 [Candidatus Bathyarchaeia archaeon]|nr:hypothetical protein [Candidatus Bathyarchaeia archaeon]